MNSTLVDNATLDFLIESTKKNICNRMACAATSTSVEELQEEIRLIEDELKKFNSVAPHFVTEAFFKLNELKPISTTEL